MRLSTLFVLGLFAAASAGAQQQESFPPQAALVSMGVVGYADRLSVQPGETVQFMVSSELPRYQAEIVRLIHGDPNPLGPGMKEILIDTPANGEYAGRRQELPLGSYVMVPDAPELRLDGSFTITAWIAPTRPGKVGWADAPGAQGIVTKWSQAEQRGYGLFLDEQGRLAVWLGAGAGQVATLAAEPPLRPWVPAIPGAARPRPQNVPTTWYFVAATFDAATRRLTVYQQPTDRHPNDPTRVVVEQSTDVSGATVMDVPLLIGAHWTGSGAVGGHYNGKIDNPKLYDRALTRTEVEAVERGSGPEDAVAAWDFSAEIATDLVRDTTAGQHDGRTMNLPTRAVTGHLWDATEMDFRQARDQYAAIYFHEDDLLDSAWDVGFRFEVPDDLQSGVYAARLRTTTSEDYVPFFVRPPQGTATARIALLIPTFSYLAYASTGSTPFARRGLSTYSAHIDGSGVTYSSRLRPITDMRPKIASRNPWQFMADTHLVDWLEVKGFSVDIITDGDLHFEGPALLEPYNVVMTGTHPEYYSWEMLQGMRTYLEQGGRLMYMGGNGFYWVTPMDPTGTFVELRRRDGTEAWQGAPGEGHHSITGEPGGLWRFRGRAPQWLVGVGFTAQGFDRNSPYQRMPGSFDPRVSFIFDGIGDNELIGNHPSLVLEFGGAGSELDRVDYALGSPPHTLILASSFGHSDAYQQVVEEVNTSNSEQGGTVNTLVKADMAYVEYPNGGAVFSTSSIAWGGSLSFNDYTNNVSRITENVLRRFAADEPLPGPDGTTSGGDEGADAP
jgi:N,N-dimethylformamidase